MLMEELEPLQRMRPPPLVKRAEAEISLLGLCGEPSCAACPLPGKGGRVRLFPSKGLTSGLHRRPSEVFVVDVGAGLAWFQHHVPHRDVEVRRVAIGHKPTHECLANC